MGGSKISNGIENVLLFAVLCVILNKNFER